MPLFQCAACGCVENAKLSRYDQRMVAGLQPLCSACDPEIGQWHGRFPRRLAEGLWIDRQGQLWRDAQVPDEATGLRPVPEVPKLAI